MDSQASVSRDYASLIRVKASGRAGLPQILPTTYEGPRQAYSFVIPPLLSRSILRSGFAPALAQTETGNSNPKFWGLYET